MEYFAIYLEANGNNQRPRITDWREKFRSNPNSFFIELIKNELDKSLNGSIPFNDMRKKTNLNVERFNSIIEKMVNDKQIEIKKIYKSPESVKFNKTKIFIVKYGSNINNYDDMNFSIWKPKNQEIDLTDKQVIDLIYKNGGMTTVAHLKYEYSKKSFEKIMKVLNRMKDEKLIDFIIKNNRYRSEPSVMVFLPKGVK